METRRRPDGRWALVRRAHTWAWLLLGLTACQARFAMLRNRADLDTTIGQFTLEFADGDREAQLMIQNAVRAAGPTLARWGQLREPVLIRVLPTHELLEEAVSREGYGWLKAWARYNEVFIQSPRTWGMLGANQAEVDELVLHELTHCLMYQSAATRGSWGRKEIPLWFREGMASYTAEQAYRWPTLEDLARFYEQNRGVDPVAAPNDLYRTQAGIVYGAAHHAFGFLVRRYSRDSVKALLKRMSDGAKFPEAFESAIGVSAEKFVRDFRRYVTWRGFRVPSLTTMRGGANDYLGLLSSP